MWERVHMCASVSTMGMLCQPQLNAQTLAGDGDKVMEFNISRQFQHTWSPEHLNSVGRCHISNTYVQ